MNSKYYKTARIGDNTALVSKYDYDNYLVSTTQVVPPATPSLEYIEKVMFFTIDDALTDDYLYEKDIDSGNAIVATYPILQGYFYKTTVRLVDLLVVKSLDIDLPNSVKGEIGDRVFTIARDAVPTYADDKLATMFSFFRGVMMLANTSMISAVDRVGQVYLHGAVDPVTEINPSFSQFIGFFFNRTDFYGKSLNLAIDYSEQFITTGQGNMFALSDEYNMCYFARDAIGADYLVNFAIGAYKGLFVYYDELVYRSVKNSLASYFKSSTVRFNNQSLATIRSIIRRALEQYAEDESGFLDIGTIKVQVPALQDITESMRLSQVLQNCSYEAVVMSEIERMELKQTLRRTLAEDI